MIFIRKFHIKIKISFLECFLTKIYKLNLNSHPHLFAPFLYPLRLGLDIIRHHSILLLGCFSTSPNFFRSLETVRLSQVFSGLPLLIFPSTSNFLTFLSSITLFLLLLITYYNQRNSFSSIFCPIS